MTSLLRLWPLRLSDFKTLSSREVRIDAQRVFITYGSTAHRHTGIRLNCGKTKLYFSVCNFLENDRKMSMTHSNFQFAAARLLQRSSLWLQSDLATLVQRAAAGPGSGLRRYDHVAPGLAAG